MSMGTSDSCSSKAPPISPPPTLPTPKSTPMGNSSWPYSEFVTNIPVLYVV